MAMQHTIPSQLSAKALSGLLREVLDAQLQISSLALAAVGFIDRDGPHAERVMGAVVTLAERAGHACDIALCSVSDEIRVQASLAWTFPDQAHELAALEPANGPGAAADGLGA